MVLQIKKIKKEKFSVFQISKDALTFRRLARH